MNQTLKFASLYILAALNMDIVLTPTEEKIFSLLKEVISTKSPSTILRVAGGWVRDKLMGQNSNDIDIAVSDMTGEDFSNLVVQYMKENGIKTGGVTVVQANPDQSKHLATAMIRILGLPIDFVNLRTETYSDSRIPTMQIGTPEEDAQRRDLTINSMFYNINTGTIEDFVDGVEDLKNGIARTPLPPLQTFLDDPLRILRTVRFASRYDLKLDPELIQAAHNPQVQEAFRDKLSKERIWTELAGKKEDDKYKPGALIGPNPTKAMQLLKELGLLELIFDPTQSEMEELQLTENMVPWNTEQNNPNHQFDIWEHTIRVIKNLVDQTKEDIKEDKETYLVRNIAALLHDLGKRYKGIHGVHEKGHTTYIGHEEVSAKLAEKILDRLKAPNNIKERVIKLIDVHLRPHNLLESGKDKAYRKYVRDFKDWPHSIDLAIADNLGKQEYSQDEIEGEKEKYEILRGKIQQSIPVGTETNIPRPINGKDLIQIGIKPGPIMGQIFNVLDEMLLENPYMEKNEAIEIAKQIYSDHIK